jgi:hypothetical protein
MSSKKFPFYDLQNFSQDYKQAVFRPPKARTDLKDPPLSPRLWTLVITPCLEPYSSNSWNSELGPAGIFFEAELYPFG